MKTVYILMVALMVICAGCEVDQKTEIHAGGDVTLITGVDGMSEVIVAAEAETDEETE